MTLANDVGQLLSILLCLLGPVPACLLFVGLASGRSSVAERWTLLILAWCVLQITAGTLLGAVGLLRMAYLGVLEAMLFVFGWMSLRGRRCPTLWPSVSPLEACILAAVATLGASSLILLVREPTTNVDSLLYHLPQIAQWVQDGRLSLLERFDQIARYPFGWEVLCALFVLPRHDVMLAALPNLIAWSLLGCSVVALARRSGATRVGALVATSLVLSVPEVVARLTAIQVDLALAAFFLATLVCGRRAIETRRQSDVVATLAGADAMLAVKLSGLAYVAVLLAAGLGVALATRRRSRHPWPWSAVVAGLLAALLIAGFWYVRNLVDLGNPFGYLQVRIAGHVLLEGSRDAQDYQRFSLAHMFHLTSAHDWRVYWLVIQRGLGWRYLALIASASLLPWFLVRRSTRENWRTITVLLALLAATAWLYWTSPYSASNENQDHQITPWVLNGLRYGFGALALLAVAGAVGLRALSRVERWLTALGVAAPLAAVAREDMMTSAFAFGVVILLAWTWRGRLPHGRSIAIATCFGGAFVLIYTAAPHRELRREALFGDTYVFLRDQVPEDATFGILTSAQGFLLHGPQLTRRVVAVGDRAADREAYLQLLRDEGIQYVASGPFPRLRANWRGLRERRWMSERDRRFEHVFGDNVSGQMYIYRFDDLP